ncbi:MAG TPA: phosphohistidine phosphatase SixA [Gemmatimonadaceae bacterium]|nr:phosphohistidine phosphatase SixA [Gemmatimonadaceae bacterium]
MKLLVIRHGVAMDQEEFAETGQSDEWRPLTRDGKRETKKIAKGIRRNVKQIDLLATSPLVRARQTGDIVADEMEVEDQEVTDVLKPEAALEEFVKWCEPHAEKNLVAIVGHEPHLSALVTWLVSGNRQSRIELKKGGACLIEFDAGAKHDSGTLAWLLTPRQLVKK